MGIWCNQLNLILDMRPVEAPLVLRLDLPLEGLISGGCVRSVSKVPNELNGVKKAEVFLDKRCAVVDYDTAKLNRDRLKRPIEEVGHEVAG